MFRSKYIQEPSVQFEKSLFCLRNIIRFKPTITFLLLTTVFALAAPLFCQSQTALRGQVTDQSGAIVPGAKVILTGASGEAKSAIAAKDGSYSFSNLALGDYTVQASSQNLALTELMTVTVKEGTQTLNLQLSIVAVKQEVSVTENTGPTVTTEADNNASATILRGADLDALSDDPDDLAADLQALAGPAAGPNGGEILIDGFSGGQIPPKSAIREIRINQNPFSPEYDKLGFGRIEIFTKPGSDKFHGTLSYNFANEFWNSRNPYAAQKAPFNLNEFAGDLSGPISKRASFYFNAQREMTDNGAVINTVTLDPQTLASTPFTGTLLASLRRTIVTPRVDYQINANNTLVFRYSFSRDDVQNLGAGGFNLASRAYHSDVPNQTVQVTETAVLNSNTINETRFQFFRNPTTLTANSADVTIQVLNAFNGGGSPIGHSTDTQNNFELQNITTNVHGKHTWKFGVRLRGATDSNSSPQNFGGTFTFEGGLAPQLDANNHEVLIGGQPVMVTIDSIEQYRRTLLFQQQNLTAAQIRALGGGASQFSISAGNPLIYGSQFDMGIFFGDEWRARPNVTVSYGLRYELQSNIHDWHDFAPRIGLAWAPGGGAGNKKPNNVIRAGFGVFYDRFALANTLTAQRYNGTVQQQYVIDNPDFFPNVPPISSLGAALPPSIIQQVSPNLRAPYLLQSALSYERQLPFNTTVAVTYANGHGLHLLRSIDINAPQPGTFDPSIPNSGVFPLGHPGPVFMMESAGLYNQNQIIVNVNSKVNSKISLTGSYMYNRAMSNTDGLGTFPANPYDMTGEYGPASTDIHHRMYLSGTIMTVLGIRFNPLLIANTGPPFDITTGSDIYGDTLFNARPGIATNATKPGVIATPFGLLDPNPTTSEVLLPRNSGRGPGQIMFNMRVGRTFSFGGKHEGPASTTSGGGGGAPRGMPSSPFSVGGGQSGAIGPSNRRYGLTISMQMRNLLNHNNPGPIIGDIASPLFGKANQPAGVPASGFSESANNRRLELQVRFTF